MGLWGGGGGWLELEESHTQAHERYVLLLIFRCLADIADADTRAGVGGEAPGRWLCFSVHFYRVTAEVCRERKVDTGRLRVTMVLVWVLPGPWLA